MNLSSQNKKNIEISIDSIRKCFTLEKFPLNLIEEIENLVKGSTEFNIDNIKAINWRVIVSNNSAGQIYSELEALVKWWRKEGISPIYATSLQRLKNGKSEPTIVMKFSRASFWEINQVQQGAWMFGDDLPDIASKRISDWRDDVYFSWPLRFLVLSTYDGDGGTAIAGPSELIDIILDASKNNLEEDHISWQEI
ncbi:hypothetical protein [Comamonas sp. CMM02]|uniref:hypothetical protein n=1 Tax=Comamonas sp. CMM02 TaxID=2769307 RepID=UPI0017859E56|nr:hypothetical protein [Comamonas sp. CMM02]MBD9402824.1 hypothetical protein [Comamonas sp. CMM02]